LQFSPIRLLSKRVVYVAATLARFSTCATCANDKNSGCESRTRLRGFGLEATDSDVDTSPEGVPVPNKVRDILEKKFPITPKFIVFMTFWGKFF
jgi:hypothetical protein